MEDGTFFGDEGEVSRPAEKTRCGGGGGRDLNSAERGRRVLGEPVTRKGGTFLQLPRKILLLPTAI